MSVPTVIQGKNVPLAISTDDVIYKTLTCAQAHDVTFDAPIQQESTDCGRHTALDVSSLVMTFQGVVNSTPNGASEMSSDGLIDIVNAQTPVYLRTTHANRQIKAYGYINNFQTTKATQELLKYSFTFTADGNPTITTP